MSEDRNALPPAGGEDASLEDWETEIETDDAAAPEPVDEGGGGEDAGPNGDGGQVDVQPPAQAPPRQTSVKPSASERFQQLANENRSLRERFDALERERAQPRQPSQDEIRAQQQREEQQMLERVQILAPHEAAAEVSRFYNDRTRREVAEAIRVTQYTTWDATDRANYERELAANPRFQRFADRVEELRRQAPGVSRVDLLDKAMGEAFRRNLGSATTRQRNAAAVTTAANTVRAPASGSNVSPPRTQATHRGYEHLRNVQI